MADFQQKVQQKSAVRIFAIPIADVNAFNALVQDIIMKNPFGCVSYYTPGINHPPIEKVREMYTAKFVYTDSGGKRVGSGSEVYNSIAGFNAGIAAVTSHIANIAAHGGTVSRNPDADSYAVSLKCHDAGGELFFLNLARDRVTLSSYRDDAIRTRIEIWTDSVPALL
jgi:hypothetical protein